MAVRSVARTTSRAFAGGFSAIAIGLGKAEHPLHALVTKITEWGDAASSILVAAFAHHGRPISHPPDPTERDWPSLHHYDWRAEAAAINDALRQWFAKAFQQDDGALPTEPPFHHMVAGFISLADWVGSDKRFFPYQAPFDAHRVIGAWMRFHNDRRPPTALNGHTPRMVYEGAHAPWRQAA